MMMKMDLLKVHLIDKDEDGVWEIFVIDSDENGKNDQAYLDT